MQKIKELLNDILQTLEKNNHKNIKVALGFFGITRSVKYTIDSIKNNFLNVKEQTKH